MGKRESPKKTGISEITGKVINIRHAIVNDIYFIENILQKHHFDITDLDYRQFVVALEDTKPIGIGRLKKTGRICEIGCVLLIEEQKRRGIADIIMKTLRRFYITSSLSMKRFLLILIFIHIFIAIASCSQTVGTNPQDVEDIFLHGGDRVKVDVWVENLKIPWALVFLKDGRALVSERPEQIRLIKNGRLQEMPYMEIEVAHVGEGGLLGLALHPEFPKKPYIYAYHTYKKGDVHRCKVSLE